MKLLSSLLILSLLCVACGSDVEGTYSLDKEEFKKVAKEMGPGSQMDSLPEPMRKQVEERLKTMVDEARMDLTLNDDGTFTVDGTIGGSDMKGKGTYEVDDDKISMTMTHQNGKKLEKEDTINGTIEDGVIKMKPDSKQDMTLTLRK